MPQYMVTMNLTRADPLLNIGRLTDIVRGAILPSLERLKDLQSKGKVLAGGHPVGQRYVVLFMEAESEDELHEMLGDCRFRSWGTRPRDRVEELRGTAEPAKRRSSQS
jgi:hypothetical protein